MPNNCIGAVSDYGTYLLFKEENVVRFSSFSPDVINYAKSFEEVKELAEELNRKHHNLIGLAVTHEQ